jgi:predicted membrane protein DUF2339
LRRNENRSGIAGIPVANIPSILTAAGTTVAYATIYAAYALYGFVGPAAAFVLLGVVALATLGAALLHGPALAALGLVGAEIAPLLVASGTPDYWALYIYLAVVTAAAFALARARLWRWLAITTVAFGLFWEFPGMTDQAAGTLAPHVAHVAIGYGLAALLIVAGLYCRNPRSRPTARPIYADAHQDNPDHGDDRSRHHRGEKPQYMVDEGRDAKSENAADQDGTVDSRQSNSRHRRHRQHWRDRHRRHPHDDGQPDSERAESNGLNERRNSAGKQVGIDQHRDLLFGQMKRTSENQRNRNGIRVHNEHVLQPKHKKLWHRQHFVNWMDGLAH